MVKKVMVMVRKLLNQLNHQVQPVNEEWQKRYENCDWYGYDADPDEGDLIWWDKDPPGALEGDIFVAQRNNESVEFFIITEVIREDENMEWDPSHLHLYWPLRRINFPEDYYDCFLERTYDENGDPSWNFDAFDERDVGWAVNVMAKRYTMVSRFLSLMDQGMEYDVEQFKEENGTNWRKKHWYGVYREILMEHYTFNEVWDVHGMDMYDDLNQVNLDEMYD